MKRIHKLLNKIENKQNFCITRFNDGEITAIKSTSAVVTRGDQKSSPKLSKHLIEAISYKDKDYYVGIPCRLCYPNLYNYSLQYVDIQSENVVPAVIFTNRNWLLTIKEMKRVVGDRRIIWVSGNNQKLDKMKSDFKFNIVNHIKTKMKDSYIQYESLKNSVFDFKKDDLIILSCGPLSRILAYEWWKERQDCTFLDVGSLFDPFTQSLYHNCHKWDKSGLRNKTNLCDVCNIPKTEHLRLEWESYIKKNMDIKNDN